MSGVRIHLDGLDAAMEMLRIIPARAANAEPMWRQIGSHLERQADRRFETEREPSGNPWPRSLRAMTSGGRTLTDSARLRQSITSNATQTGVETGTNVLYAAIQQFGGTITAKTSKGLRWSYGAKGKNSKSWATKQSVTIPARPFIGLEADDPEEIGHIAMEWVMRGDR